MTAEEWRPIPGYEGYEVSDHGRVRSIDRVVETSAGYTQRYRSRVLVGFTDHRKRRFVLLGRRGSRSVASLVMDAFVGPRPLGMNICHNDGNALNNRLTNLRWDTQSENILDCVRHGTHNQARKTHCPRHHALIQPNLCPTPLSQGKRVCLACSRGRATRGNAAKRGEVIDMQQAADGHYADIMGELRHAV